MSFAVLCACRVSESVSQIDLSPREALKRALAPTCGATHCNKSAASLRLRLTRQAATSRLTSSKVTVSVRPAPSSMRVTPRMGETKPRGRSLRRFNSLNTVPRQATCRLIVDGDKGEPVTVLVTPLVVVKTLILPRLTSASTPSSTSSVVIDVMSRCPKKLTQ
jgi:hypothetical protein